VAQYCNTRRHTATYCNTPHHTATHLNTSTSTRCTPTVTHHIYIYTYTFIQIYIYIYTHVYVNTLHPHCNPLQPLNTPAHWCGTNVRRNGLCGHILFWCHCTLVRFCIFCFHFVANESYSSQSSLYVFRLLALSLSLSLCRARVLAPPLARCPLSCVCRYIYI